MANQERKDRARYFSDKFRAYDEWRERNPQPTQEDYVAWRNETFKMDSDDFVSKMNAPQVQQKPNDNVAPQGAIDYLKSNPELKEQFKAKYGYIPEGI
jgi:hypothetical protein